MKLEIVLQHKGSDVETIRPDETVATLIQRLAQRKIGALVVSGDGAAVEGIVSERDVITRLASDGPGILSGPVSAIMTRTVTCAPLNARTRDLMGLMTNSRIRHVPVLDDAEQLVGIVSIGDVVKSRMGELEYERDALVHYVTVGG
jgi:CBS domain-containing protein